MELEKFKNIKAFIADLQISQLDQISNIVLANTHVTMFELSSTAAAVEYRRKIAFVARALYNVSGIAISDYLMVSKAQISEYIYSAFQQCKKDENYLNEIRDITTKLVQEHQAIFNRI